MRIELAKLLLQNNDLLLLDEPTNHLDIESIIWLEGFLKTISGAVVIVSHDKMFLDNVTNRTIEISLGRIYDYNKPYTKFLALRKDCLMSACDVPVGIRRLSCFDLDRAPWLSQQILPLETDTL